MPNVSVIIPAYNAEAYIAETVQSALDQTYRDFEIIVVDDGSTDRTAECLEPFGDKVRVLRQPNGGVAQARNNGVKASSGAWLAFLDADDLWLPRKIERQLAFSTAPMTFTDRYNFGARGPVPELQSEATPMKGGDLFLPLLLEGNFITLSSVMLRRDRFDRVGGFYTGLAGTADWDMWIRVAEQDEVGFLPEPLVRYRFHSEGMSRNFRKMGRERMQLMRRALALDRARGLDWLTRRQIWAGTWRTNAWEAGQAGARTHALANYARAAAIWPLKMEPYREAVRVCLGA